MGTKFPFLIFWSVKYTWACVHVGHVEHVGYAIQQTQKVIIRLDELRQFLKDCKYPEHVIGESNFNAKLQVSVPNRERSKNVIPFVTTYYPNIDKKSLMQTIKTKFKNIRNEKP